jgi:phage baseplate assembly protein gpV
MANNDISIQLGEINSVNYPARTVKVLHQDANGSVSTDLPLMRPKLSPDVGDPILCVYLSNGAAYGVCLGEFYQEENTPADDGQFIEIAILPDGSSIQYDTTNKKLILNAQNIDITVSGGANVINIKSAGPVNIDGGTIAMAGGGAAIARVGDTITATGSDPQGGTVTVTGTITSGSSKVQSG